MVLGLGRALNFVRRRNRGESEGDGASGLPSTTREARLQKAEARAAARQDAEAVRTLSDQARWEQQTLARNLEALQTPDPRWQPPDVRPQQTGKMTLRDKMAADYVYQMTKNNIWYYRDRLSTPRGPCNIWTLRDCWSSGVIDENTLMWGQGLADWVPAKNVNMLIPQIRNFEVRVVTFFKKHLSLKPALKLARKRAGLPQLEYSQLDNMH